ADHLRDPGGGAGWAHGGGADELRRHPADPRRRDGRRGGDDSGHPGGGDVSGWDEAGDRASADRVSSQAGAAFFVAARDRHAGYLLCRLRNSPFGLGQSSPAPQTPDMTIATWSRLQYA